MSETFGTSVRNRLVGATGALLATQLVHELVPGRQGQGGEPWLGLVGGFLGLATTLVAIVAAVRRWPAAGKLAVLTGGGVIAGFALYHGLPVKTSLTNSYWDSATIWQWLTLFAVGAAGAWCIWTGTRPRYGQGNDR